MSPRQLIGISMYAVLYILTGTYLKHSTDHSKSGQPWLFSDDKYISCILDKLADANDMSWPFIFDNNPEIEFKLAQRNEFEIINVNKL